MFVDLCQFLIALLLFVRYYVIFGLLANSTKATSKKERIWLWPVCQSVVWNWSSCSLILYHFYTTLEFLVTLLSESFVVGFITGK